VTSARTSAQLGRTIGLAWVAPDAAREGADILIRVGQADERASVTLGPFYDPDGERQKG
jgi:glycine cleavage system aminomethyltransferase T